MTTYPDRPVRKTTKWIVVHRITGQALYPGLREVEAAVKLFREHPDGVKLMGGDVPYTYLVDSLGVDHQFLDELSMGAHAYGANGNGLGIGVLGDFRSEKPTDAQVLGVKRLCRDLLVQFPDATICGHDDVLARQGKPPKPCPGPFFPLDEVVSWAALAAAKVASGADRR